MQHHLTRTARAIIAFLALTLSQPALAQTDLGDRDLDGLFVLLDQAPDRDSAQTVTNEIWARWTTPDDPELAAKMDLLLEKRRQADLVGAMALADEIIAADPSYAEGWNQRATLAFIAGDYEASLADIAETLKREPRHFGALSGKVLVLIALGDRTAARDVLRDALAIHPFLPERGLFPDLGPPPTRL